MVAAVGMTGGRWEVGYIRQEAREERGGEIGDCVREGGRLMREAVWQARGPEKIM